MVELSEDQQRAISKMHNGSILCGKVGSGKSRTSIGYYIRDCGGDYPVNNVGELKSMSRPRDCYVITTAKKRNSRDWVWEFAEFRIFLESPENSFFKVNVVVDSWNNIKKYINVKDAFFIFDEQRVVGTGTWARSFIKISKSNRWVLLSATPGDTWDDYRAVFIANGFFKNKTEFDHKHVVQRAFVKYRDIDHYVNEEALYRYRSQIMVVMKDKRTTRRHEIFVDCEFDKAKYQNIWKFRWDPYEDKPIEETGKLFYLMRRVSNDNPSRITEVDKILKEKKRAIIFYNFNYELESLKEYLNENDIPFTEYNGQVHEDILIGDEWVYLVQYAAGAEAWNCITTDTIIFYSQNYSYKTTEQAMGRIDRTNTPYEDLYYYKLISRSPIDRAIRQTLSNKQNFNEKNYLQNH
jgi:superfamily II DNA or RNA helicase